MQFTSGMAERGEEISDKPTFHDDKTAPRIP
jgi:hypothetical protein